MHEPFTRPRTTLDLRAPGALVELFARTRREFGGHTMTVGAPEGGQQAAGDGQGQQQAAAQQTGQQQTAAAQTDQQQGAASDADLEPRDGEDDEAFLARVGPRGAAKLALKYRRESGDRRQETLAARQAAQQATDAAAAERQQLLDSLKPGLVKLGVLQEDETPDASKLARDLEAANAQTEQERTAARTMTIENAVLRAAPGLGVNADKLLDSRRFADTLAALDPTADDFGGKVSAAIKAALEADATLRSTREVRAAGMSHVGGSGGQQNGTPRPLADAVANAMNPTR